jgi:hypothetical protein
MFNTEGDFDEEIEAIGYATRHGLLVAIGEETVAVNPTNGHRYMLTYDVRGFYWERL